MTVPSGTRQLQSCVADAKRCGIEKHAEIRYIDDRDVDGTTVSHDKRIDEIAGREKLSCEPTPQVTKINQDLGPRPWNTSNGRFTSYACLTVEHLKRHIHHLSGVRGKHPDGHSSVRNIRNHVLHQSKHRNARRDIPAVHLVGQASGLIGKDLNERIVDIGVRA